MITSNTPETDAAWACFKGYTEPLQDVQDLSRKLERERDEARAKYDILAVENMLEVNKLCNERDEARDQLIHLRSCVYDVIHSLKAGAFDELEKAWKENLK